MLICGCASGSHELDLKEYELDLKERGFKISFPCKYQHKMIEKSRKNDFHHIYNCTKKDTYSYTVKVFPGRTDYEVQKSLYEHDVSDQDKDSKRRLNEKLLEDYKILEYFEDDLKDDLDEQNEEYYKKKRYADIFKDDFKVEISASYMKKQKLPDSEIKNLADQFKRFFESAMVGQAKLDGETTDTDK